MSLLFTHRVRGTRERNASQTGARRAAIPPRGDAEPWRRVFLKYADVYMTGSKAPDDEFKDFKNHVLHVRDNYWGGAPEKAVNWYGHLVEALRENDFERAVYAAGVLSITTPIHSSISHGTVGCGEQRPSRGGVEH